MSAPPPTRNAHEFVVHDAHTFAYDPNTHLMLAAIVPACYIYQMSATESQDVHTEHGLHKLEIQLMNMIDNPSATFHAMSRDQLAAISPVLADTCKPNLFIMKLN